MFLNELIQLGFFTFKAVIIVLVVLFFLAAFFAILAKNKLKEKGRLSIKHLNKKYQEAEMALYAETLPKKEFKKIVKSKKANKKTEKLNKKIYVLHFNGDIKASATKSLSEEITMILSSTAKPHEVILCLESPGGMVHGYGLAAAQLMRLRTQNIPLTVCVDKVAASGGYLMASIANKILAAPFAIIGSIGVIVQMPNFHRLLKNKHIDFEQLTAGEFKRTLTVFGENTEEGREKLQEEIEEIHDLFKHVIAEHRPHVNINQVATGEHWVGQQALGLKLIDDIKTADDYLLECAKEADLYEISYEIKKPFLSRLSASSLLQNKFPL